MNDKQSTVVVSRELLRDFQTFLEEAYDGGLEGILQEECGNHLAELRALLAATPEPELSDEDLCRMAAKAFGQVVDYDLKGNPITDYSVLLIGAYGPAVRRLVSMARAMPVEQQSEPVAWRDPKMPERMCTAEHKRYAEEKGGAMATALLPLTEPLYRHAQPPAKSGPWEPLSAPGQIKPGDWLHFTVGGKFICTKAKEILEAGTHREEVVYNRRQNHYFITSMAVEGTSSHKGVMIAKP